MKKLACDTCGLAGRYPVSYKHGVSIFREEVYTFWKCLSYIGKVVMKPKEKGEIKESIWTNGNIGSKRAL
jgi:hypothetical protein